MINLHSPYVKEFFKYLGWILLFVFLWFCGCSGSTPKPQIAKVIVPEVKAKFEAKKPVHEPVIIKANSPQLKISTEPNPLVQKLIEENVRLVQDFAKANDSIKQLSFNKAIQLNKFSTKFEDDNLVININGVVQGEVKEVTPNYTIKERKMEVPVKAKETVFRLLGGLELGNNTQLDAFKVKANLMFQNRKGNIISGSFDTNQTVWVGYNISIFDIKK
jgi:hypothetical protein